MGDSVTNTAPTNNQYNANNEWMPIVANGLGIVGSTIGNWWASRKNLKYQQDQNAINRQTNWDMYWTDLNEQRKNWAMQNEYNSPAQQMKRFEEAGLNPYLAMTKGAQGADAVPAAHPSNSGGQPAPQMDNSFMNPLASIGEMFLQATMVNAQTENLRQQRELIEAQTANTLQQTSRGAFELSQLDRLKDVEAERKALENQKISAETSSILRNIDVLLERNDREAIANSTNVRKTLQDILESKQRILEGKQRVMESKGRVDLYDSQKHLNEQTMYQIDAMIAKLKQDTVNAELDEDLKQWQLEFNKSGLNSSDNAIFRLLWTILRKHGMDN